MNENPALALMKIESAINHMQNTMMTKEGKYNLDETFFELFDDLLQQLQETRKIAQTLREQHNR